MKIKHPYLKIGLIAVIVGLILISLGLNESYSHPFHPEFSLQYRSVEVKGNLLELQVAFPDQTDQYEILEPVRIASDKNLNEELPLHSVTNVGKTYVHQYDASGMSGNQIFIAPPVMLYFENIEPITLPLDGTKTVQSKTAGPQFKVDHFDIENYDEATDLLTIRISPLNQALPRFPKLELNGKIYDGMTGHTFDLDNKFTKGELMFLIDKLPEAEQGSLLDQAKLIIDDQMTVVQVKGTGIDSLETNTLNVQLIND